MSGTLRLRGATSGYSELQAPAVAADQTFILPTAGGTLLTTDSPIAELTLQLGSASAPSLRFEGDTDTGLYSSGTNTLNLVTGGSNRLNIDNSGNVGIGTTSPSRLLTVGGISRFENFIEFGGSISTPLTAASIYRPADNNLAFGTASTERMRIDSSGNVGIGSSNPVRNLQLGDNTSASEVISLQTTSSGKGSIYFGDNTSTSAEFAGMLRYDHADNSMQFRTSSTEAMRIDSSGNVGIGTTSSDTKLDVRGDVSIAYNATHALRFYNEGRTNWSSITNTIAAPATTANLEFKTGSGTMVMNHSGNVGIGTSSPSTLLHLETGHAKQTLKSTNTNTASSIIFDTTNVTTADFLLGQIAGKWNGTDVAQINFEAGSDTTNKDDGIISFATSAASGSPTERMRIDSSGRVGIGTTSPAKALEIYRDSFPCLMLNDGGQYKSYIQLGGNDLEIRGSSGTIEFYGGAADGLSSTERMRIDGSGRVGINTFGNTGAGLHVDNVTGTTGFGSPVIKCGGSTSWTGNGTVYSIGFGYVNGANVKSPAEIGLVTTSSSSVTKGDLVFATRDVVTSTAPLERMRITSDGDVGIGTDSPYVQAWGPSAKQLHVTGSHYGVIHFTNTTYGGTWSHGAGGSSKQLYGAYDLTHTTHWMEIFPGTGVTRFKGVYDNGSSGAANVYVHTDGGLYRSTSSIKYKTDVETLENQYADAILNCRPVWYRSLCDIDIVDKDKQKSNFGYYGFIAEEVADIDPRLVSWKTTKTVKATDGWEQTVENLDPSEFEPEGVNYTTFIPLMLNLIKRQSKEIELLKNKVAALEAN